jgi:hypothetical protein
MDMFLWTETFVLHFGKTLDSILFVNQSHIFIKGRTVQVIVYLMRSIVHGANGNDPIVWVVQIKPR